MTNYSFSHIAIIYNPNSTGDSARNAKKLQKELLGQLPDRVRVTLHATEYAGHAEELASTFSAKYRKSLIVSASGDGGYNEVINGVIAAGNEKCVVAVLPSGNANDHARAVSKRSLARRIVNPSVMAIDAIAVEGVVRGERLKRYAHSYVGFGLTAYIGQKLTEESLDSFKEKWIVLKYLLLFKSISLKIEPDLRWHRYSSVIFSNIKQMSKIIKLAPDAHLKDDRIEVYVTKARSFVGLLLSLLFASTIGLKPVAQVGRITMHIKRDTAVQLDGEVEVLDAGSSVVISVATEAIKTLR